MKKRGKSISFDAMVKYFMRYYDIPTKKDIDKLMARMDMLERLIKEASAGMGRNRRLTGLNAGRLGGRAGMTASDMVLEVVKNSKEGANFAEIQDRTGFEDKKLRNIIYRLSKIGKIHRMRRGVYAASS